MVYNCIGIGHVVGNNLKTGKPYDFYSVNLLLPVPLNSEGKGYYSKGKTISKEHYDYLNENVDKYPCHIDIDVNLNGYVSSLKIVK